MIKTIAVLTSGGDSPGMNGAIRAVTRSAISRGIKVVGVKNGFLGLVNDNFIKLERSDVSGILVRGGTMLGSARLPGFTNLKIQEQAISNLKKHNVDALVVVGGDGSYRGALSLSRLGINSITIPGTIDNDIPGTDETIGFDTALNTAIEAIDRLRDTSSSHHRCSVVEVMGNECGDLALYSGLSTGAELVITPETGFDYKWTMDRLIELDETRAKSHAIVVVSEKLTDVEHLAKCISQETSFAGRSTILGYIQRGGSPTAKDRILATRMGDFAVFSLLEGKNSHAICIDGGKLITIELEKVLKIKKKLKKDMYELQKRLV